MSSFDDYVERAVLHNKLIPPAKMAQAKAHLKKRPDLDLLGVLVKAKLITPQVGEKIKGKYSGRTAGGGSGGAAATAAAPAACKRSKAAMQALQRDMRGIVDVGEYMKLARDAGASDLHFCAEAKPMVRLDGDLVHLKRDPLTAEEVEGMILPLLPEKDVATLRSEWLLDSALDHPEHGRFRICFVRQQNGYDAAFRLIGTAVPSLTELGLPAAVGRLADFSQGLVLITGPGGSGKTTTINAMLALINKDREDHIITIEDPVEYLIPCRKCHISQRQVGDHTESFSAALRGALREDPDVIMIGEMRDTETASLAISASETGHLVFTSLHTTSAVRTIGRILDMFPPNQQGQVRSMISESIRGIVCQMLLPRADGAGRVMATEIMYNRPAVSNLIREDKMLQLPAVMQLNAKEGMTLMDHSIAALLKQKVITRDVAVANVDDIDAFENLMKE